MLWAIFICVYMGPYIVRLKNSPWNYEKNSMKNQSTAESLIDRESTTEIIKIEQNEYHTEQIYFDSETSLSHSSSSLLWGQYLLIGSADDAILICRAKS